jgi:hypothetical protein
MRLFQYQIVYRRIRLSAELCSENNVEGIGRGKLSGNIPVPNSYGTQSFVAFCTVLHFHLLQFP